MACSFEDIVSELELAGLIFDVANSSAVEVFGAACNSREVAPGNIFVCKGRSFKPAYLDDALAKGAVAVVCDSAVEVEIPADIPAIITSDIRPVQAVVSKVAWGKPDERLTIVGVTGTQGKTTTTTFVKAAIEACTNTKCGFIGTHLVFDGAETSEPPNTTPEPPDLYRYLNAMVQNGATNCVMEISSQGLKYDRVYGLDVNVAAITNIGIDHIAPIEHPSVEDYVATKFRIAEVSKTVVVNKNLALLPEVVELAAKGMQELEQNGDVEIVKCSGEHFTAKLKLPGAYNKENAACALEICKCLGLDVQKSVEAICDVSVEGRMEVSVSKDGKLVGIVDYAHTKNAFVKFFNAIHAEYPGAFIITYFGCSAGKAIDRQVGLPQVAGAESDYVVVTSDEPFGEDPQEFAEKIAGNLPTGTEHCVIANRDEACDFAFAKAAEILSKGTAEKCVVCALAKGAEDVCPCSTGDIPIIPDTKHVPMKIAEYDEQL
ncbi:MAG: Mur ligase family protein [Phoenicibacter congonensis]|uniref:Mur ligase family protein n=1 Tax=Phoenicibacter congonensis TaxID=1944646 RepID=A0AA43U8S5_9ACTN|nr:Mur ligase family protein [Phoenicibacter congonensis]